MESWYPDGPLRRLDVSVAARQGGAGMRRWHTASIRLLPLGSGLRLAGATLIIAALWGRALLGDVHAGGP